MTKWEYMSTPVNENCMFWDKNIDGQWQAVPLSYLGVQRWELVSVVPRQDLQTYGAKYVAFLKRQLS